MTISNRSLFEEPYEKLLNQGPSYLSDSELLSLFFRPSFEGKGAVEAAHDVLSEFGDLKNLLNAHPPLFYQKTGIGKTNYALLKAAIELGRRYLIEPLKIGEKLTSSHATKRFLANRLKNYPHEVFACLFLTTQNRLIQFEELFQGTLNEACVYPREVIKRCLTYNAGKVILAHNHPSGDAAPSLADEEITLLLKKALLLVDIQLIDHIVVGRKKCFSFAETGLL